ncbi:MAG: alkaline phosphatase, partial [Deltaproteobacteria bacterium]
LSAPCALSDAAQSNTKPAKYLFLFIGDGMGTAHRSAAAYYQGKRLRMDSLPVQGITTTHAANRLVTGSAAAATALASGIKTNIGMLGVGPDRRAVATVAELAEKKGMKVGIISSVSIDHATPAGFYAHVPSRRQYYDIAIALGDSGFDFFGGGGLLDPRNKKSRSKKFRGDAVAYIKSKGYKVVDTKADFMKLTRNDGKIVAWNHRLPDGQALPYALDATESDISLAEFTAKAIQLLDNKNGFFLMVEGGKIDWAAHANDAATTITDTLAFDEAVGVALDFASKHPDETLIVVTADHECGGLSLGGAGAKHRTYFDVLKNQKVSFQKFTDDVIKPYRRSCGDNCSFEAVKKLITENLGLKFDGDPAKDRMVLTPHEIEILEAAYEQSMSRDKTSAKSSKVVSIYGRYEPITFAALRILNRKAGLRWASDYHTAEPVPTSAQGVGASLLSGHHENTDIAKVIMAAMGLAPEVHYLSEPKQEQEGAKAVSR